MKINIINALNIIASSNGLKELSCTSSECYSWIIVLFDIFTIFYLVFCAYYRVNKTIRLFGWILAGVLTCVTVGLICYHTCIFTLLCGVFTGLVLMAVLAVTFGHTTSTQITSTGSTTTITTSNGAPALQGQTPYDMKHDDYDNSNSVDQPLREIGTQQPRRMDGKAQGSYVIHWTSDKKVVFALYDNERKILTRSLYKFDSIDEVKKAICYCRDKGMDASIENKVEEWVLETAYPKFELYSEGQRYYFRLMTSPDNVVLLSNGFEEYKLCLKTVNKVMKCVGTNSMFVSKEVFDGSLHIRYQSKNNDNEINMFENSSEKSNNVQAQPVYQQPVQPVYQQPVQPQAQPIYQQPIVNENIHKEEKYVERIIEHVPAAQPVPVVKEEQAIVAKKEPIKKEYISEKSIEEKYQELSISQKRLFNHIKAYALKLEGVKKIEERDCYKFSVKRKIMFKLRIEAGLTIAVFTGTRYVVEYEEDLKPVFLRIDNVYGKKLKG